RHSAVWFDCDYADSVRTARRSLPGEFVQRHSSLLGQPSGERRRHLVVHRAVVSVHAANRLVCAARPRTLCLFLAPAPSAPRPGGFIRRDAVVVRCRLVGATVVGRTKLEGRGGGGRGTSGGSGNLLVALSKVDRHS